MSSNVFSIYKEHLSIQALVLELYSQYVKEYLSPSK